MARVVKRRDERILTRLADEFEQLAAQLNSRSPITMEIGKFTQACRLVSPLIRHLGVAMKFADIEYSAKNSSSSISANLPSHRYGFFFSPPSLLHLLSSTDPITAPVPLSTVDSTATVRLTATKSAAMWVCRRHFILVSEIELGVAVEDKIGENEVYGLYLEDDGGADEVAVTGFEDLRRLVGEEEDYCLVTGLKHQFVFGYRDGKVLGLTDVLKLLGHVDSQ